MNVGFLHLLLTYIYFNFFVVFPPTSTTVAKFSSFKHIFVTYTIFFIIQSSFYGYFCSDLIVFIYFDSLLIELNVYIQPHRYFSFIHFLLPALRSTYSRSYTLTTNFYIRLHRRNKESFSHCRCVFLLWVEQRKKNQLRINAIHRTLEIMETKIQPCFKLRFFA